jgi:hypothetical protein
MFYQLFALICGIPISLLGSRYRREFRFGRSRLWRDIVEYGASWAIGIKALKG